MFKKIMLLGFAAATAVVITGCSTIGTANKDDFNGMDLSAKGTAIGHVSATTHGLYFLWFPLITGDNVKVGAPVFLKDTVNAATLCDMVTAKGKGMGGSEVVDLVSASSSSGFLFSYKMATASGTIVK